MSDSIATPRLRLLPLTPSLLRAVADGDLAEVERQLSARVGKGWEQGVPAQLRLKQLAADASDSASKANGGLIGPILRSDLSPELLKEITPLKVGQITRALRTTRGYQIIKLESATETKVKTMDEARAEIADKVAQQKARGQMQQYMAHLRSQAIIDWKNDEVKKAYEVGVKQQSTEPTAK